MGNPVSGDIDCGEGWTCTIEHLTINTIDYNGDDEHEYEIEYAMGTSTITKDGELYEEENEVDSTEEPEEVAVEEIEPVEEVEVDLSDDTSSDINTDFTSATGKDWVQYSYDQKYEMVSNVIDTFEANGDYSISVGPEWFIDAIDAFYGDGTTVEDQTVSYEKVSDVMLMSGVGGGVFE